MAAGKVSIRGIDLILKHILSQLITNVLFFNYISYNVFYFANLFYFYFCAVNEASNVQAEGKTRNIYKLLILNYYSE